VEDAVIRLLATFAFVLATFATAPGQPKADLPDEKVAKAWEAAEAEYGMVEWSPTQTRRMFSRSRPPEKAGEIPAFHITPDTKLTELKDAGVPFGLILQKQVGDGQIKSLPTFRNLQYVLAYGQPLTDAAAKDLARQKGLRYIDLGRSKMTGAGMKDLATLPALETLHVDSIKVGNVGLAELVKIKTLRDLNLDESGVTYDALPALTGLENLESLGLLAVGKTRGKLGEIGEWVTKLPKLRVCRMPTLTDSELKHVGDIRSLRDLRSGAKAATDAGIRDLVRAKDLESLTLGGLELTAAGYKDLASLKKLRRLVLFRSNITDAELKAFAGMTSLKQLSLEETKVTDAGVAELKKALPMLTVEKRE